MAKEVIYCVDDEINILQLLKYNLEQSGFTVHTFETGEDMLVRSEKQMPDMFILDLMLPGIDGIEICKKLRQNPGSSNIPIIMLTAKNDEFDRVLGLELGADDYITKPFSVRELTARIKALFRRSESFLQNKENEQDEEIISFKDIIVNCSRREIYKDGVLIEMPLKEFDLLRFLMMNKGKVLSRELLLEKIWGFDYFGETRTVDVHIRYLRQKIEEDDSMPKYIETVRGIGYKFTSNS